jgi:hypothetical protein
MSKALGIPFRRCMGLIQSGKYSMMNCSWYAGKLGTRVRFNVGNDVGRGSYTLCGCGRFGIRLKGVQLDRGLASMNRRLEAAPITSTS